MTVTARKRLSAALSVLMLCAAMAPEAAAQPSAPSLTDNAYRIGAGDALSVSYPYNPELNLVGPVGPDGRFMVPLVGNLPVAGLTLDEVAARIGRALRDGGIVADARPVVSIQSYGAVVYVGGEVRLPGAVKLSQTLDPLQAVISAGGALDTARTHKIVVLHRLPDGRIDRQVADLRAYAHRGEATGIVLQPQDIVFVPRSSIAEADLWIAQHVDKLLPFSRNLNYSLGNSGGGTVVTH